MPAWSESCRAVGNTIVLVGLIVIQPHASAGLFSPEHDDPRATFPTARRGDDIPLLDLSLQEGRRVVVDREEGRYLGRPSAVLIGDGKTVVAAYPEGQGRGAIVPMRSTDRNLPPYDPTERYESRRIEGWTVLVNEGFLAEHPGLADRTLTLLRYQLYQVVRRVPLEPLNKLRAIRIWVEGEEPHHPCMAYHPDSGWLREHGMNPEKARCVEVANARNFLSWTLDQPWMVLHELAHGYHHQCLDGGFDNAEVDAAYRRAKEAKLYESVLRINGKDDNAYAVTDPMEYFAEASEAFFGTNDFYPYVRSELRRHDPEMFALLKKLWGQD